jgi:hypothetical protein
MITDRDVEKLKKTFVTKVDIEKLKDTFVTKDEFHAEIIPMKADIAELKSDMGSVKETTQQILTVVDGISKKFDDLKHEYVAVSLKGDRHEKWIKHLADKTGNELPEA